MKYSWLQKSLIVFLELTASTKEWHWLSAKEKIPSVCEITHQISDNKNLVISFDRFEIIQYWLMLLKLNILGRVFYTRSILLIIEDGLYKYVYVADSSAYRTSRKGQCSIQLLVNKNQSYFVKLRNILISRIPLTFRAAQRYIFVTSKDIFNPDLPREIGELNHMFFSSPDKKLLLASYKTLRSGDGQIFKTTANIAYDSIIAKEYEITLSVSQLCKHHELLPKVSGRIDVNGRTYYHEKYIVGHPLAKMLRSPNAYKDTIAVCTYIDQLDSWYREYRSMFTGCKWPLQDLYEPLFKEFYIFFTADTEQCALAEKVQCSLAKLYNSHPGLIPVIAHGDLWPANILVTANGLVAIDWERATPNRPEMFDYFWMIISTALEYLSSPNGFADFTRWFKCLLTSNDSVCIHARNKLEEHLKLNGIPSSYLDLFIAMFLMEFAIRGGLSLNRQTDMDILAGVEFRHFVSHRI